MKVIKEHNNIRNLVLIFDENDGKNCQFPQLLFELMNDILRKNKLIGLVLHGVTMTSQNGKRLSEVIGSCVSLKFFSLKVHKKLNDYFEEFVMNLSKNKLLTALSICGGNLTKEHIKILITRMQGLKVFDYRDKLN